MTRLTIVSDDLTGALDATGPLSAPGRPLVVTSDWGGPDLGADLLAVSTETREGVTPAEAARRVARVMAVRRAQAGDAGLWLKKIDSMLRGPWPEEVAASVAAGDFARVVVVPAFPGMGRRTVGGLQEGGGPTAPGRSRASPSRRHSSASACRPRHGVRAKRRQRRASSSPTHSNLSTSTTSRAPSRTTPPFSGSEAVASRRRWRAIPRR
jgi:uncharacterized protein YgbK (DUF1537 family)